MVNIYNEWNKQSDKGLLSKDDAKRICFSTPGLESCVPVGSTMQDIFDGVEAYGIIAQNDHWILCLGLKRSTKCSR